MQDKWLGDRTWVSILYHDYKIANANKSIINRILTEIKSNDFKLYFVEKCKIADYADHKSVNATFYFISYARVDYPPLYYRNKKWEEIYNSPFG